MNFVCNFLSFDLLTLFGNKRRCAAEEYPSYRIRHKYPPRLVVVNGATLNCPRRVRVNEVATPLCKCCCKPLKKAQNDGKCDQCQMNVDECDIQNVDFCKTEEDNDCEMEESGCEITQKDSMDVDECESEQEMKEPCAMEEDPCDEEDSCSGIINECDKKHSKEYITAYDLQNEAKIQEEEKERKEAKNEYDPFGEDLDDDDRDNDDEDNDEDDNDDAYSQSKSKCRSGNAKGKEKVTSKNVCQSIVTKLCEMVCLGKKDLHNQLDEQAQKLYNEHLQKSCADPKKFKTWYELRSWQKLPFYWLASTNDVLYALPFDNFKRFYAAEQIKECRQVSQKVINEEVCIIWHSMARSQRLPFVIESFIFYVTTGRLNIHDESGIKRTLTKLRNSI